MKSKKQTLYNNVIIFCIMLFSSNLAGQVNHLVPCSSFPNELMKIDAFRESNEYYEKLEDIINKNLNGEYIIKYISKCS